MSIRVTNPGGLVLPEYSSAPSDVYEGKMYVNSSDDKIYIYYGGTWQVLHTLTPAAPAPIIGGAPIGLLLALTYPEDGGG